MISFANCKINLGLNITGKRSDGYHDLETVFYPIPLKDIVEVIQAADFNFTTTGLHVEGSAEDNLCVKAYKLLKSDFPQLPDVQIHLHKVIPMGAGLGGGSADGAFILKLLDRKFRLHLSQQQLLDYALQLGSDCAFFIINTPCFAQGRGEVLEPVNLNLSAYCFALVNPEIHVSTKTAFSRLTPQKPRYSVKEIISQPVEEWKGLLKNDFEETVFGQHPEIAAIKESFYLNGAIYASMTGTGSTVYGIFENDTDIKLSFPENYFSVILPKNSV